MENQKHPSVPMKNDSIQYEPIEQVVDDPISLEKQLMELRDKKLPHQQALNLINHEIEQAKSKLKIATLEYWQNKGK